MNLRFSVLYGFLFSLVSPGIAQNPPARPLTESDKQEIMKNIAHSPDWNTINQLKMMRDNFPSMAPSCEKQINTIFEYYRFTLISLEVMKEENVWKILLKNLERMQKFSYEHPPTQQDLAETENRRLQGKAPVQTAQEKLMNQLSESLKEAEQRDQAISETDYYHTPDYLNDLPNYTGAQKFIKEQLQGERPLLVKDAYYMAEASYGNLLLTYDEYNKLIKSNADFIRQWLKENRYDVNNPEMLHFGIQKFMSDTLYITVNGKRTGHLPYYYDYIDFTAKEDKRNYFVTKTLATGTGQCHTFPVTYLILAEALGIEAFIAYNPQHSFIQYNNKRGTPINYETTVDRILADAFYLQTVPIMATAQKNKLYTYSLSKKQVVASVLYDLAANFIREHWVADRTFIKECLSIAKPYFPDQGYISNTESYLYQRLYADDINALIQAKGIKHASEIVNHPELVNAYREYYAYMEKVSALGIQEFPEEEELRMLEYADKKGRFQVAKGIRAKEKKSLFID